MYKFMILPTRFALIVLALLSFDTSAQDAQDIDSNLEVELNWKLSENDTIKYSTVLGENVDASFHLDTEGLFDGILDDSIGFPELDSEKHFEDLFKDMQQQLVNKEFVTFLYNSAKFEDVIDIEVVAFEKQMLETDLDDDSDSTDRDVTDDISDLMVSMFNGTMLRGSVHKTGDVYSFWVKQRQKNLISLLFELPTYEVKKGDTWSLKNVSFIGNDQNFICEEARQHNVVTFTDVKSVNGETIAVLEYDLYEYVSGLFSQPSLFGSDEAKKPSMMSFAFRGKAEFSIEKGRWISYTGLMKVESTGFMNSKQTQKFSLIEQ
jgi:hypothetical protein